MTSSRSRSVAEKAATTVPGSEDSETFFSELYELNSGEQSFTPVSVTVTCTHVTLTSLTARNYNCCDFALKISRSSSISCSQTRIRIIHTMQTRTITERLSIQFSSIQQ